MPKKTPKFSVTSLKQTQQAIDAGYNAAELRPRLVVNNGEEIPVAEGWALKVWHREARARGYIVASPTVALKPAVARYTFAQMETRSPVRLTISHAGVTLGGEPVSAELAAVAEKLVELEEAFDLTGHYSPVRKPPKLPGETFRWPIRSPLGKVVGAVLRFDEPEKKYVSYFYRDGEWQTVEQPPCDLLPFMGYDHYERVVLTEGPKAMDGALEVQAVGRYLPIHNHTIASWHGAEFGTLTTDWSVFAGRVVSCYCDTDADGYKNMLAAAREISRFGGFPRILKFGDYEGTFDFANPEYLQAIEGVPFETCVPPLLVTLDEEGKPVSKLNPDFAKVWIWSHTTKTIHSNISAESYSEEAFRKMHGSAVGKWMASPLVRKASALAYLPGSSYGLQKNGEFNIAQPHPLRCLGPAETGDLPPHFAAYLEGCLPDKLARDGWLDMVAQGIAYPDSVAGWAMVIQGPPGTGKTTLAVYACKLLGSWAEINVESLGNFQLADSVNVSALFIEEMYEHQKGVGAALYKKLKAFITSPRRIVNLKYGAQFSVQNVVRLFVTSNEPDAVLMAEDDRRWLVLSMPEASPVFNEAAIEEEWRAIYRALWRRGLAIKALPKTAPRTAARAEMIQAGMPTSERRLVTYCSALAPGQFVLSVDLCEHFGVTEAALRRLRNSGMLPLGQRRFTRRDGWQPQFSVWMRTDSKRVVIPTSLAIAKGLVYPGKEASRSYLVARLEAASLPRRPVD